MPRWRRAISRASTAEKMRLKPQLSHDVSMAKTVTRTTAPLGERARSATRRMRRLTGCAEGDVEGGLRQEQQLGRIQRRLVVRQVEIALGAVGLRGDEAGGARAGRRRRQAIQRRWRPQVQSGDQIEVGAGGQRRRMIVE